MVSPQSIRAYLLEKFADNYRLSSGETELIIPSVFTKDDYKRHMSVNLDTGLWQCFKSGNKGNFLQLYSFLEGISYSRAEAVFLFKELEDGTTDVPLNGPVMPCERTDLCLEEVTLESFESPSESIVRAWNFLYGRKLFNLNTQDSKYYISNTDRYANRVIIPFEEDGELYYFQARTLVDASPKYLNPMEGWAKPSHILYPFDRDADFVVVCEGPLDAISLQNQGVNATCTMGCSISDIQMEILKNEFTGKIIIGYDNDSAGQHGINKFDYLRRIKRMADIYICHPPSEVKDWNDAHMKDVDLQKFIDSHTKKYDYDYLVDHLLTTM